jgi:hypothetical protein
LPCCHFIAKKPLNFYQQIERAEEVLQPEGFAQS